MSEWQGKKPRVRLASKRMGYEQMNNHRTGKVKAIYDPSELSHA